MNHSLSCTNTPSVSCGNSPTVSLCQKIRTPRQIYCSSKYLAELKLKPQRAFTFFFFFFYPAYFSPLPVGCCSSFLGCMSRLRLWRPWGNWSCVMANDRGVSSLRVTGQIPKDDAWQWAWWREKKLVKRKAEKKVGLSGLLDTCGTTDTPALVIFTVSTFGSPSCQPIKTSHISCSATCQLWWSAVMTFMMVFLHSAGVWVEQTMTWEPDAACQTHLYILKALRTIIIYSLNCIIINVDNLCYLHVLLHSPLNDILF